VAMHKSGRGSVIERKNITRVSVFIHPSPLYFISLDSKREKERSLLAIKQTDDKKKLFYDFFTH
jgi:hypothetical protein